MPVEHSALCGDARSYGACAAWHQLCATWRPPRPARDEHNGRIAQKVAPVAPMPVLALKDCTKTRGEPFREGRFAVCLCSAPAQLRDPPGTSNTRTMRNLGRLRGLHKQVAAFARCTGHALAKGGTDKFPADSAGRSSRGCDRQLVILEHANCGAAQGGRALNTTGGKHEGRSELERGRLARGGRVASVHSMTCLR